MNHSQIKQSRDELILSNFDSLRKSILENKVNETRHDLSVITSNGRWGSVVKLLKRLVKKDLTVEKQIVEFPDVQKVSGAVDVKFPEVQKISGVVEVKFPKIQQVKTIFPKLQRIFGKVDVDFPETQKVSVGNFPEIQTVKVSNVSDIKSGKVEVTNLPVAEGQDPSVKKANPTVYVPVRLTDGRKFIDNFGGGGVSFSSGGNSGGATSANQTNGNQKTQIVIGGNVISTTNPVPVMPPASGSLPVSGTVTTDTKFNNNNIDDYTTTSVTYIGQEDSSGTWRIKKIDETGNFTVVTWASITNNATKTTYSLAWTDRVALTYNLYSVAF